MSSDLLAVTGLVVSFATRHGGVRAVDGLDLRVRPGQVMGLVGESGSGKTVTLRAILRLLDQNATVSGRILWHDQDLLSLPMARMKQVRGSGIGMIFQEPMSALNPVLTIGRQIDESLLAHTELDWTSRRRRAVELLELVAIPAASTSLERYPHEFSGGMRQRVMIAIALAAKPELLLADEPTTALDVTIQDQLLRLLRRLTDALGMSIILVTHDFGVVAAICDRATVVYAGQTVECGPTQAVLNYPRHAYTLGLLRSVPTWGRKRTALNAIPGQASQSERPIGCAFLPRCDYKEAGCALRRPPLTCVEESHFSACIAAARLPPLDALT
jgi:oligopeptide/dipeptide ABC transporter ATP-binding protein